jgi:hypothetical protein
LVLKDDKGAAATAAVPDKKAGPAPDAVAPEVPVEAPARARKSPLCGILVFVLALLQYASVAIVPTLILASTGPDGPGFDYSILPLITIGSALVVAVIALVIAILGLGRGWAIAALTIATTSAVYPYLPSAFGWLFGLIFGVPQISDF